MGKADKKEHVIFSNASNNYNCDIDARHQSCVEGSCDCAEIAYGDECRNLDMVTDGKIIAIASIGTWRGARQGYKLLGYNLKDILSVTQDYNKFYFDGSDVRSRQYHHDGTNTILFRELRTDRTDESVAKFLERIYNGEELTPRFLSSYTKSLSPYMRKIYGW